MFSWCALLLHDDILVDDLVLQLEGRHIQDVDVAPLRPQVQVLLCQGHAAGRNRLRLAARTQSTSYLVANYLRNVIQREKYNLYTCSGKWKYLNAKINT